MEETDINLSYDKKKKLGSGGQGVVYRIKIENLEGYFVDKVPTDKPKSLE